MLRFASIGFVVCVACNAIDGADGYEKAGTTDGGGDGSACTCLDTAASCLSACTATRDTCVTGCNGNPGCTNKCNGAYGTCTNGCVDSCTQCGVACTTTACENAATDGGGDQ